MPAVVVVMALLQGVAAVGLLLLLEALIRIFAPGWELPFSAWWGLLFALPGLAFASFIAREE